MRKFVLTGLAILLALSLSGCEMSPLDDGGFAGYEFDAFGNITSVRAQVVNGDIIFGTPSGAKNARALSQALADVSFEVFEVVFYDGAIVARATWELGSSVSLKNVTRGVDYISVDPDDTSAANMGAAVLFAGRKNGTLLAVGKITAINDDAVSTAAVVDLNTVSITFGLAALVGDADNFVITEPAAPPTTDMKNVGVFLGTNISPANYKGYILRPGITNFAATYTLASSANSFPIADIAPAIRMISDTGNAAIAKPITPRILLPMSKHGEIDGEPAMLSATVAAAYTATSANNQELIDSDPDDGPGDPNLQINLTINSGANNGVIALYFQIPVYAIVRTTSQDGVAANTWYIRPGYNYNYLSIGANGTGGSVLIAVDSSIEILSSLDYSTGILVKTGAFLSP